LSGYFPIDSPEVSFLFSHSQWLAVTVTSMFVSVRRKKSSKDLFSR